MNKLLIVFMVLLAAALMFVAQVVEAPAKGPGTSDDAPASVRQVPDWAVQAGTRAVAGADFDDREAGASVLSSDASLSWREFKLEYSLESYDWDDASDLPFGGGSDPWDELHSLSLSYTRVIKAGDRWSWLIRPSVGAAWEEEMDDSYKASAMAGLVWAASRDLQVTMGFFGAADATGAIFLPALGLDWRRGRPEGLSASLGIPKTGLRYGWNKSTATRASLGLESRCWRLADDSKVERKGYARVRSLVWGLYQDFFPADGLTLSLGAEYLFMRDYAVYNDDGESRANYSMDPAPAVSLRVKYAF